MRKAPLFWLAICFVGGVIFARYLPIFYLVALIILLLAITVCTLLRHPTHNTEKSRLFTHGTILAILGIVLLPAGYARHCQYLSHIQTDIFTQYKSIKSVEFRILEPPPLLFQGKTTGKWRTKAAIERINGESVAQKQTVLLSAKGSTRLLHGDTVYARNILLLPPKPAICPGGFSYADYLHTQGITTSIRILGEYTLIPTEKKNTDILRWLEIIRIAAIRHTLQHSPSETGGFIAATLFGYRKALNYEVKESFRTTGIGHILAISGLHVGLIILLVNFICLRLHFSPPPTSDNLDYCLYSFSITLRRSERCSPSQHHRLHLPWRDIDISQKQLYKLPRSCGTADLHLKAHYKYRISAFN